MKKEYLEQDIDNPTYLFHGSPYKLDVIKPHLSHDSLGNTNNIANAVFLFPKFLKSTPYAFKDTIKANSQELHYNFVIPNNDDDNEPLMIMENVNVDSDIVGYVYVFKKDEDMIKDDRSYQYKCYKELKPIDVVEVHFKDYEKYYRIDNQDVKVKLEICLKMNWMSI